MTKRLVSRHTLRRLHLNVVKLLHSLISGRMIASVPVAIGSAMEHFAEKLLEAAAQCVQSSSARTLTPSHMWVLDSFDNFSQLNRLFHLFSRYAILKNKQFSFLEDLTINIPTPPKVEELDQPSSSKVSPIVGEELER